MVSQRGIEINLEKIRAIVELGPPKMVKEVQSLNRKIVNTKQVRFKGDGQMPSLLPHIEEIV